MQFCLPDLTPASGKNAACSELEALLRWKSLGERLFELFTAQQHTGPIPNRGRFTGTKEFQMA